MTLEIGSDPEADSEVIVVAQQIIWVLQSVIDEFEMWHREAPWWHYELENSSWVFSQQLKNRHVSRIKEDRESGRELPQTVKMGGNISWRSASHQAADLKEISRLSKHGNCSRPIREMVLHQTRVSNKHFPLLNISLLVREAGTESEVLGLIHNTGPVPGVRKPKNLSKWGWLWSQPSLCIAGFSGAENNPDILFHVRILSLLSIEQGLWLSCQDEIVGCLLFNRIETL